MSFYSKLTILLAATIVPFLLSGFLTRKWRMQDYYWKVWLVLFTFAMGAAVCVVGWPPKLGIDLRGGVNLIYELAKGREEVAGKSGQKASQDGGDGKVTSVDMDQLIAAISKRINPGGQKEITIRKFGPGQIEIIIPEADEAEVERIKDKISRAGTLEFRITANPRDNRSIIERARASNANEIYGPKKAGEETPPLLAWWVPVREGRENTFPPNTFVTRTVRQRGKDVMQVLVVADQFSVTGQYLLRAGTSFDERGRPDVTFHFNSRGAQLFGQLTTLNKPDTVQQDFYRQLGIILDGYLYSAPRIQSPIFDNGQISGDFSQREAQDLADVLNAGALPAALNDQPISELRTGPTLGSDTIQRGSNAIILSTLVVFAFMLVYYRFAGVVACSAVVVNLTVTIGIMIMIKAALTLPGLAGLALTVAMAVDANVLIFERIREEMAKQATLRMAIRNGFGRAQSAIVDSNLTTLISSIVLYAVGTDQIKGFAVTLTLGVAISMFTAVFCAHVVFDVAEKQKWISKLRMMRMFAKTNIDFYGARRKCYVASLIITMGGLVAVFARGSGLLDIDFTGGVSVQAVFNQPQNIAEIREKLSDLRDLSVSDMQSRDIPEGQGFIINTGSPPDISADDYLKQVKRTLAERFQGKLASNEMTIGTFTTSATEPSFSSVTVPDKAAAPEKKDAAPEKKDAAPEKKDVAPEKKDVAPEKKDATSEKKATEPKPNAQTRTDLPGDHLLASANPAAILLTRSVLGQAAAKKPASPATSEKPTQAKPAAKPVETKPVQAKPAAKPVETKPTQAKPAAKPVETKPTQAKPAAKPVETKPAQAEPATKPAETEPAEAKPTVVTIPASPWTETTVNFDTKINYASLESLIRLQLDTGKFGSKDSDFRLFNENRVGNSEESFLSWQVALNLPRDKAESLLTAIKTHLHETPFFPASNTIGGKVAGSTRVQALYAIVISNVLIMVYLWVRFQRLMYGVAAVVALVHDVLVALGFLAVSYWLAPFLGFLLVDPFKIGLTEVAAFLTLVGFSVNDTVVVFDRVREVKGKSPRLTPEVLNSSVNQTLSRTVLTSLTVMLVVLVLYVLGGPTIHGFAFAMVIGVFTGTYSSVFVAAPLLFLNQPHVEEKRPKGK